jgi:hypothetical protein
VISASKWQNLKPDRGTLCRGFGFRPIGPASWSACNHADVRHDTSRLLSRPVLVVYRLKYGHLRRRLCRHDVCISRPTVRVVGNGGPGARSAPGQKLNQFHVLSNCFACHCRQTVSNWKFEGRPIHGAVFPPRSAIRQESSSRRCRKCSAADAAAPCIFFPLSAASFEPTRAQLLSEPVLVSSSLCDLRVSA